MGTQSAFFGPAQVQRAAGAARARGADRRQRALPGRQLCGDPARHHHRRAAGAREGRRRHGQRSGHRRRRGRVAEQPADPGYACGQPGAGARLQLRAADLADPRLHRGP